MIQNVLRHMGGIENYGIISLLLFFACFFGMLIWVVALKKPFLKHMSQLPLDTDTEDSSQESHRHE
jgi:hypothetical protein